jgi:hypothetical protein
MYENTDYDLEIELAKQRAKRYEAMRQQPEPQGQMVGGRYIAPSGFEYLAKALRERQGNLGMQSEEQKIRDLHTSRRQAVADALRQFGELSQGTAENRPGDEMGPVRPAQAPNMRAAYGALLNAPDTNMRSAGITGLSSLPQLEAARAEREAGREQRAQEYAQNLAFKQQEAEQGRQFQSEQRERERQFRQELQMQNLAAQREARANAIAMRPEPTATVLGPNGEAITVPRSQAQGLPLYNPQAASQLQKEKTKQQAKQQLSDTIAALSENYTNLAKGGGISSSKQTGLQNIGAWLGANAVGQYLGGVAGTENQAERQKIEQTRPLLLNLIKEATGMSAQQMNSNAEMQMYLKAATDPKLTLEANQNALQNLDKMFGLGLYKPNALQPTQQQAQQPAKPNIDELLRKY